MKHKVTVSRMDKPEHYGDWHDKPCKWLVTGPNGECQKFSTRKDAELYAKIRRRSSSFNDASGDFVFAAT